jgi:hypothetical protein
MGQKMGLFATEFEVKFLNESAVFEGYASVFDRVDSVKDRVQKGAFEKSLKRYVALQKMPPLLWQHEPETPIGAWRVIREDERGLFVRGELFVEHIQKAREAYKLLKEGVLSGLSIGYRVVKAEIDQKDKTRFLREIDLLEISLVTFPAQDEARISAVKTQLQGGQLPDPRSFELFLRDAGFSRKQAKEIIACGYKSLSPRDAEDGGEDEASFEVLGDLKALTALLYKLST